LVIFLIDLLLLAFLQTERVGLLAFPVPLRGLPLGGDRERMLRF
jgi:hypothetical protein